MRENSIERVSVVMCTYNGAEFVTEQLESILFQSRPPQELVVADDGSSDGTLEIVREIVRRHREEQDPGLDYVELTRDPDATPEPFGVAGNFERGLRAATGGAIALSDQDDRWRNDRLDRLVGLLEHRPEVGLVHSDAALVDAAGEPLGVTLFEALGVTRREFVGIASGRAFEVFLRRNLVTGATAVVRRSIVERALPIPEGWIHDEWLAIVAAAVGRTAVLREPLIDYRQHGGNQIGATKLTWHRRISKLREPREERNENLLVRAEALVARIDDLAPEVSAKRRTFAVLKLDHERVRYALPDHRRGRIGPVLVEWMRGRYGRYGLGAQDVLRDLVQPN